MLTEDADLVRLTTRFRGSGMCLDIFNGGPNDNQPPRARRTVKVTVFGMKGLTDANLLITLALAVGTVRRMIVCCTLCLLRLAPSRAR